MPTTDRVIFEMKNGAVDPAASQRQLLAYAELIARRYGLYVTPTKKEQQMPAQNPYDRRNRPRSRPRVHEDVDMAAMEPTGPRTRDVAGERLELADEVDYKGLTLADLEFLVQRKVGKARRDGDDAAFMRERERTREAQQVAWTQGWQDGARERGYAVRDGYERHLGDDIHSLHSRAVAAIEADTKTNAGRKATTRDALLALLRDVAKVTDEAIKLHRGKLAHLAETGHEDETVPF